MKTQNPSKAFNNTLWAAQVFLALVFFIPGAIKLFTPIENLYSLLPWTKDVSSVPIRLIGFSEILGSIGLILPSLLKIKPQLTPLAALGVAVIMLLAVIFNISIGHISVIGINIILFWIAVFVAWGRFKKSPIPTKYSIYENPVKQN